MTLSRYARKIIDEMTAANTKRFRHSLQTRIVMTALLVFLVTLWSFAFYATHELRSDVEQVMGEQQAATVTIVSAQINHGLDDRQKALEALANSAGAALWDGPIATQRLLESHEDLLALFNRGVFVIGTDGIVIADFPADIGRIGLNVSDRDYIALALREGRTTISPPFRGKAHPLSILSIAAPIRDLDGKTIGVLSGSISLDTESFIDRILENRYGKTGSYQLLAPRERIIITGTDKQHNLAALPAAGVNPDLDHLLDGTDTAIIIEDPEHGKTLASSRIVPLTGWTVIATLPTDEAFAPIRVLQQRLLLATLILTILMGLGAHWLLNHQFAPLRETADTLADMTTDKAPLHALPVTRPDEIGHLIGGFNRLIATLTERETSLKDALRLQQALIEAVPSPIFYKDANCIYLGGNKAFSEFLGLSPEEYVGKGVFDISPPDLAAKYEKADRDLLANPGVQTYESSVVYADGSRRNVIFNKATFTDSEGRVAGMIGFIIDITSLRQAEEEIRRLAFFDVLTGLPNRRLLLDRLGHALPAAVRHGKHGALMFLDLDNFKTVNDTQGHDKGDLLLQQAAERLKNCVRESDTVARLGGDEFIILLEDLHSDLAQATEQARHVGEKILAAMNVPFDIFDTHPRCPASVGITLFSGHEAKVDDLLKEADIAMYRAKNAGRNGLAFFTPNV